MSYVDNIFKIYGLKKTLSEKYEEFVFKIFIFENRIIVNLSNLVKEVERFFILNLIEYLENKYNLKTYALSSRKKNEDNVKIWYYNYAWSLFSNLDNSQIFEDRIFDSFLFKANLYSNDYRNFSLPQSLLANFNFIDFEINYDYNEFKKINNKYTLLIKEKHFKKRSSWEGSNIKSENISLIINQSDLISEKYIYFHSEIDSILSGKPYILFSQNDIYKQMIEDGYELIDFFEKKDFYEYSFEEKVKYLIQKIKEKKSMNKSEWVNASNTFYNLRKKNYKNTIRLSEKIIEIMNKIFYGEKSKQIPKLIC